MKRLFPLAGVVAGLLCTACSEPQSPLGPSAARPAGQALGSTGPVAEGTPETFSVRAESVPFQGSFEGTQTVTPLTPPFASVETSAVGTGTHLGRFTIELPHTVNFATSSAQGTCTIVAANGDTLVASFTGQAQVGPIVSIVEQATITGGTGRFAGASGTFTIQRLFDPAAGTTRGSFSGTISAPGAALP
jgi:hypothetical protein